MLDVIKILIAEDSESDADLLIRFLRKQKMEFTHWRVWNKIGFEKALKDDLFDLIISDQNLPQFSGMEAFRILKKENKTIPFILLSGTVSEADMIEFAKEGIDDYILKENLLRLPNAIEHALSKKKIADLHIKLERAHKDIGDSINYAKRIQNAMLPDAGLLRNSFVESFIFFKPKDKLSGDFYWLKRDDATLFIAVADCTGHGIPGALMSMIGIEKLNGKVRKNKEPAEILRRLNKSIQVALYQSTINEQYEDGMDIALCSINKETGILKFAGANRPLWIVHQKNESEERELTEIKGTKKAIGGMADLLSPKFENNEVQLKTGDTIYMSSDGFADQFGGEIDKKLMTRRFKQMLVDIQEMTMKRQEKYISDYFEEWKGEAEQVDDILVIGVRYE